MTKEKILELLKKAGYNAQISDGVVMIYYSDKEKVQEFLEEVRAFLTSKGYCSSWGCRYQNENSNKFAEQNE